MPSESAFLWLRNDLRIRDQPLTTVSEPKLQAWIYIFDLRFLSRTVPLFGNDKVLRKASAKRALFLLGCVRDMASSLRTKLNTDLIVRIGEPEEELSKVAELLEWRAWDVYCQSELGAEEQKVQDGLAKRTAAHGGTLIASWGLQFLYHPDDVKSILSEDPQTTLVNPHHFWQDFEDPEAFVPVRKEMDCPDLSQQSTYVSKLRADIADPHNLLTAPEAQALVHLGYPMEEALSACLPDPRAVLRFHGGETAALVRLEEWIENKGLLGYYENRSGLLGPDYSSKLSPWFAAGCISPVRVYRRIRKEAYDDSVKWFISELGWRDLFRYHMLFHGSRVFHVSGPAQSKRAWARDSELFDAWCAGQTGIPYIDAHMRELAASGFMSNTGRQVVASFLSCCLGLDWRLGAMWFESTLIDHDVSLNYGNWNREARVRWSNRQSEDEYTIRKDEHVHLMARLQYAAAGGSGTYDTTAFIKQWVPELQSADDQLLLSRRSPPPVYEVLCSVCSVLDKSSIRENGKLLCGDCRVTCTWCGCSERGASEQKSLKRKWYCEKCWQEWDESAGNI